MIAARLVVLVVAAIALTSSGAAAGTGYDVTIVQPGAVASGAPQVRATISGSGIGDAERGAFHVRTPGGSWAQGSAVAMTRTGSSFTSTQVWDTTRMANGVYEIEVRIWGDLPPYQPGEASTYSSTTREVRVDNAPATPAGLSATVSGTGVWLGWQEVSAAERSDFLGYRVWAVAADPCPTDPSSYADVGTVRATAFSLSDLAPGSWCFRVTAERTSAVTGRIASVPSGPVRGTVTSTAVPSGAGAGAGGGGGGGGGKDRGGPPAASTGGLVTGDAEIADPPPPPAVSRRASPSPAAEPDLGSFEEDLPYGPVTVQELAEGDEASREAGGVLGSRLAARDRARAFGGGLLLVTLALHLRVFLGRRRLAGRRV